MAVEVDWRARLEEEGLSDAVVKRESDANHILFCRNHFVAEFMHASDAELVAEMINVLSEGKS